MSDLTERPVRVIQVEDQTLLADTWASALRPHGFHVVGHAPDFASARQLIRNTNFDLALVDLELGKADASGDRVLADVRSIRPQALRVVITGHFELGDAVLRRALRQHPQGWISKSVGFDAALAALRQIVEDGLHGWYATPDLRPAVGAQRPYQAFAHMSAGLQEFFLDFAREGDQQRVFCERFHISRATFQKRMADIKDLVRREMRETGEPEPSETDFTNELLLRWTRDRYYHFQ